MVFFTLIQIGYFFTRFFSKKTKFSTNELNTPLQTLQELEQSTKEME
jgi:hypothetical protein